MNSSGRPLGGGAVFCAAVISVLALGGAGFAQEAVTDDAIDTLVVGAEPVAAPVVLSPGQEKLKRAVEGAGPAGAVLADYYGAHDWAPVWTDMRAQVFLAALDGVGAHGLPEARYDRAGLAALAEGGDEVLREIAFSQAFLTYARDINSGLLEPREIDRDLHVDPHRPDQVALLEGMAAASDPVEYLAALEPTHPHYTDLMAEKRRLEALIADGGWGEVIPPGRTLRPGQSSPRVVAMRARLGAMDGKDYGDDPAYDEALVAVVKDFQLRHGLNDDGVAGPKTLEALNASAEDRLWQVLVNLERQRWLNFDRGRRHVYVNQADFSAALIDDGEVTWWSRAVVGQNKHRTQEFTDEMTHMVVNPTWHVPRSIATKEMLPRLKRNPRALGGSMQIMTRNGTRVNPALVDFTQFNTRNFPFIVKQRPGGGNALGRVKFMFPNQFNIYLHDTPAKSLFNKDARAFSHGCVRLQKPFEFAHALLAAQTSDPQGVFQSALNTGRERQIDLETPIPVYLTYQSAWVDNFGVPQYRADIYGRDGRVIQALRAAGVDTGAVEG